MLKELFLGYPWLWWISVAIIAQIIGALWYSPAMFSKIYMKENSWDQKGTKWWVSMWPLMVQEFIAGLLMFMGLAFLLKLTPWTSKWLVWGLYFLGILALQRSNIIRSIDKTWRSIALICGRLLVCFIIALLLYNLF